MHKVLRLCLTLTALVGTTARGDVEINGWEDLRPLIDMRGEAIVRRLALRRGYNSSIQFPRNATADFYLSKGLGEIGNPSLENGEVSGQLYEVFLKSRDSTGRFGRPYLPYLFLDFHGSSDRIQFSPVAYPEDSPPEEILKFYIYTPGVVLLSPQSNVQITYERNFNTYHIDEFLGGDGGFIYPGCYTVSTGNSAIDRSVQNSPVSMGTCPLPEFPEIDSRLEGWRPQDGIQGSGWLHASIREGQHTFEGLILVLQPEGSWLDLSAPNECASNGQPCLESTAANSGITATPIPAAQIPTSVPDTPANRDNYLALVVAPANTSGETGGGSTTGVFVAHPDGAPETELLFASEINVTLQTPNHFQALSASMNDDLGLYLLSLPYVEVEKFNNNAVNETLWLNLSLAVGNRTCLGDARFSQNLSTLAAPVVLECQSRATAETMVSGQEVSGQNELGATEALPQRTIIFNSSLYPVDASASPAGMVGGACANHPELAGDLNRKIFCLTDGADDQKVTFDYIFEFDNGDPETENEKFYFFAGPTNNLSMVGNVSDVFQVMDAPVWTSASKDVFVFDIAFPGVEMSEAFRSGLDIKVMQLPDEDTPISIEPEYIADENVLRFTLPKDIHEDMLLDPEAPVYLVVVGSSDSAIVQPDEPSPETGPTPYFKDTPTDAGTVAYYLDMKDFLDPDPVVVSLGVESQTFAWANTTLKVWASIPGTRNATSLCDIAFRIDGQDYWLSSNADRSEYTFPSDFPEVSAKDTLEIVSRRSLVEDATQAQLSAKLCPTEIEPVGSVVVERLDNTGTLYVAQGRPVFAYFLRSGTSDDKYGPRFDRDIYRVSLAPVLKLEEDRIVAFFRSRRGGNGARNFELVNRFNTISYFIPEVTENRIDSKLTEMLDAGYVGDGTISIRVALRDAAVAREDFGLSGPYWPDVVILASGDRLITCDSIERTLIDVEVSMFEQAESIGAANASLSIFYDSYSSLDSAEFFSSKTCDIESSFGTVSLFNTSLDGLFRSGRGRFNKADEIQNEWGSLVGALSERAQEQ